MNQEQMCEWLSNFYAEAKGRTMQHLTADGYWEEAVNGPHAMSDPNRYRVKPEKRS